MPAQEHVLQLQRGAGNAAVSRLMRSRTLARDPVAAAPPEPAAPAADAAADPGSFTGLVEAVKTKIEELKTADAALKAATSAAEKAAAKTAQAEAVAAHQAAVLALATWLRENTPPRETIDGYLDRIDVTNDEKVATLGQLAVGVARMEFLLGTMYHQGTKAKWETTANRGAFPDTYDEAVGGGAQPWCTKFAGYAYTRLGFQANEEGETSEFMSGWRLRQWATKGKDAEGKEQITDADQTAEDAVGTGSAVIDSAAWKTLRADLAKATSAEARTAATEAFFAGGAHPLPQAGDIVVKPRGDAAGDNWYSSGGQSHTMLVESYDASAHQIHTIEGNVGDKVGGRTIDLTSADDVSQIIMLTRMGTQFFGHRAPAAGGPGPTGVAISGPAASVGAALGGGVVGGIAERLTKAVLTALYSAENLLGGMESTNARLVEINAAQGWIQSADPNASVTDFTGATGSGNES